MKLSEMRRILHESNIQLTKSLGQNFLHDVGMLQKIAKAGELTASDKVLEIGPGLGPLTAELLERAGHVFAIEKDQRLIASLRRRFGDNPKFELLNADALEYLRENPERDWSEWKLVANLPYSVASPILVDLAQAPRRPERLVATLQLEVVERLMAEADDDQYGLLTLLVGLHYKARGFFKIPASCFHPEPDIESACITLIRRPEPLLPPDLNRLFVKVVKRSFSQRRKMMFKLLKGDFPIEKLEQAFTAASIPRDIRAEKLTLEQFVALTKALSHG
ncbi:MAG TPA: 16S rRNA (adenine(1518)-N(6)/adenine(1519)-N(6))-dimethyltransferase RsmA [Methylomirabilota bacterium]|nr:16S rRNA (adenine(1518)-N(6)/adenine(1519)-N(6))-dimethyltransferase RsmA [Methylomirabilota bacterium]